MSVPDTSSHQGNGSMYNFADYSGAIGSNTPWIWERELAERSVGDPSDLQLSQLMNAAGATNHTVRFIHELSWADLPERVRQAAKRSLIDLVATLAAGGRTKASLQIRQAALAIFAGGQAALAFDGRKLTPAGAALANATTLDSMDAHDGHRLAKGHAGAGALSAILAMTPADTSGQDLLTSLVMAYEVGLRAAQSLHASASTYHSSGSWVALGSAAVAARAMGLNHSSTEHALGIAEYHGPRSPMMRCIDHPTMVKDGTGWGCMTGIMAAELAVRGFTGAPAELIESDPDGVLWPSLGVEWKILETYFKAYPTCRWAQPAISAALALQRENGLEPAQIKAIEVETFEAASRLNHPQPTSTEEAQYSLPFPIAAALRSGKLDPDDLLPPAIFNEETVSLANRVRMTIDPAMEAAFPQQTLARVTLEMMDGARFMSEDYLAPGDLESPLSEAVLIDKYKRYTEPLLGPTRADLLLQLCQQMEFQSNLSAFFENVMAPLSISIPEVKGTAT